MPRLKDVRYNEHPIVQFHCFVIAVFANGYVEFCLFLIDE
jgi:hypothetical protein